MQKNTANPVVGSARFLVDTAPVLESGERSPCSDDVSASRRAVGPGASAAEAKSQHALESQKHGVSCELAGSSHCSEEDNHISKIGRRGVRDLVRSWLAFHDSGAAEQPLLSSLSLVID
jgi:hypothetical protein